MREREQQRVSTPEGDDSGRLKPHQRLPKLITLAFEERDPDEQRRLTTEVIDLLVEMREPGDEAEEAQLLLAHLDAKTLQHLRDTQGRKAQSEAVKTLLSLGFPHALKVSPEDLEQLRVDEDSLGAHAMQRRDRWSYARGAAWAMTVFGALTGLITQSWLGAGIGAGVIGFFVLVAILPSSD